MKLRVPILLVLAALITAALSPLTTTAPSYAAGSSVKLTTAPAPPVTGSATKLVATVTPKASGRPVTFQQRVGKSWQTLGKAKTNSHGVATVKHTFTKAGKLPLRAVAAAFHGASRATGTNTSTVVTATKVTASFPAGPWTPNDTVTVTGVVTPHAAGRVVTLQRNTGSRWATLAGPATTNTRGQVSLPWTASPVGTASYRLSVAGSKTAAAATSATVSRQIASSPLELGAPAQVTTGSTFELTYAVTAQSALSNAQLVVHAPTAGTQVTPPNDFTVGSDSTATKDLGSLAAGSVTKLTLKWAAPGSPTTLPVSADLTADGGVSLTRIATVNVIATPDDSFTFDNTLRGLVDTHPRTWSDYMVSGDCQTVPAEDVPTFPATLTAIDAFTADGTSTDGWKALQLGTHPADADDVAAVSLAYQRPNAAMAAALAGYRADPTRPDDLNIAAAAANLAGHPGWAIALETQAGTLGAGSTTGLPAEAIRLTNIGHAYALMGQYATAESWVRQALLVAPDNDQVHLELASILECQNNNVEANQQYRDSQRTGSVQDDMGDTNPGDQTWVSASKLYDLSGGTAPNLTMPTLPTTPQDLVAGSSYQGNGEYQQAWTDWSNRNTQLHQQMNQLDSQLTTEKKTMQPASRHQIEDILSLIGPFADASMTDDYNALTQAESSMWTVNGGCDGQYHDNSFCEYSGTNDDCTESSAIFSQWLTRMQAYENAFNTYYAKSWPILTGLQANLSNQTAYDLAGLEVQYEYESDLEGLDQQLSYAANAMASEQDGASNLCFVQGGTSQADVQNTDGGTPATCAAGSLASRVAFQASFEGEEGSPGIGIKRSCELVEIDISATVLPFLQGFVKIDINNDGSGVTIYAGSRAAIGSATFESSFYTEFDGHGQVSDLGISVGPEWDVGQGIQVTAFDDHIKMSAMSTFAQPAY